MRRIATPLNLPTLPFQYRLDPEDGGGMNVTIFRERLRAMDAWCRTEFGPPGSTSGWLVSAPLRIVAFSDETKVVLFRIRWC